MNICKRRGPKHGRLEAFYFVWQRNARLWNRDTSIIGPLLKRQTVCKRAAIRPAGDLPRDSHASLRIPIHLAAATDSSRPSCSDRVVRRLLCGAVRGAALRMAECPFHKRGVHAGVVHRIAKTR